MLIYLLLFLSILTNFNLINLSLIKNYLINFNFNIII